MIPHRRRSSGGTWLQVAIRVSVACWTAAVAAQMPPAEDQGAKDQIPRLIKDLGSERFQVREMASDQLARIGLPAFAALEVASRDDDREVRYRAERILLVIRKNDLERRLAAFVAGTSKDDDLPCWTRFAKAYGDSETSRQLFVDMQRAEPELLAALEREPRTAVEVLGRRLSERIVSPARGININVATPNVSPGEIAAYLFVAAEGDVPVSASTLDLVLRLGRQPVLQMVRLPQQGELTKELVGAVISRCDADIALTAMGLARELELKEGLQPALKFLERHDQLNPASITMLAVALACVADLGDASHTEAVEKLLENQAVLGTASMRVVENGQNVIRRREMQVRDAALAALVKLNKQDAKLYFGQEITPRPATASPYSTFPAMIVGFETDEAGQARRAAAIKLWGEFKAANSKSAP